jgi:hypothetical protein
MNNIIIEEKYKFIPPRKGTFYPSVIGALMPWIIRKDYGIFQTEFRGLEKLRDSIESGKAVMLTPNHCRPVDPMIVALGVRQAGFHMYTLASWHLFKQNRWQGFILPRLGVMSIYREGMDRDSLKCCADILARGERPLLVFPEGVINRTNDKIGDFLEGVSLIARMGAKARDDKEVVILPVALRYTFEGDFSEAVQPVLEILEKRLAWESQGHRTISERIRNIGHALLCLKEIEHMGGTGDGGADERIAKLADYILRPHEDEWLGGARDGGIKSRVKSLRTAVMPALLKEGTPPETKVMVWKVLRDVYLAQQLDNYSTSYFTKDATITQLVESVEKFEEDLTDRVEIHKPFRAVMTICDPIVASSNTDANKGLMDRIKNSIYDSLKRDGSDLL